MWGNFLHGRPRPPALTIFFVTEMLTRDLSAVANLLVEAS